MPNNSSRRSASPKARISGHNGAVPLPTFVRTYQACENCRRMKHKCDMGNALDPRPPCVACRRSNSICILPTRKRRGRPPKGTKVEHVEGYPDLLPPANATGPPSPFQDATHLEDSAYRHDQATVTSLSNWENELAREALAASTLRNPSDAIRFLDQTGQDVDRSATAPVGLGRHNASDIIKPRFYLIEERIIDLNTMTSLFRSFIDSVHNILPMIPATRIPRSSDRILEMASTDKYLVSAILVISSNLFGQHDLHVRLWKRVQQLFAGAALDGAVASIDAVEGLILLSEYPPSMGARPGLGSEDRMCWMTVGAAVRMGYLLGLEQSVMQLEDRDQALVVDKDRAAVAWIYCYCLDRQISIRAGKVFWHRSPGLTFQHLHDNPADDFPTMAMIPGIQEDYASYLHCQLHLTHLLSNAHDLLYPSKSRSIALATAEHYYKHIEGFSDALSLFRRRWEGISWTTFPIHQCVWLSFHHLRLYIYAFSFHAYLHRAGALRTRSASQNLFPMGLVGSSDSRFIIEAINSAEDMIRIAITEMAPLGALSYLPLRYFLLLSHAGVFLLKVVVTVPLSVADNKTILRLVLGLSKAMSTASTDHDHPSTRYASSLATLLHRISRDQEIQSVSASRAESPQAFVPPAPPIVSQTLFKPDAPDLAALMVDESQPFQSSAAQAPIDLAAEIEALYRSSYSAQDSLTNPQANATPFDFLPSSDPFASILNPDDANFWDSIGGT